MIPVDTLRAVEFHRIRDYMTRFAHGETAKREVLEIAPLSSSAEMEHRFGLVEEIRRLAQGGARLSLSDYGDITPLLDEVRPEGALLDPLELNLFIPVLAVIGSVLRQIAYRSDLPLLTELTAGVTGFPDLLNTLERSINPEGGLLDRASPELFQLRSRKRSLTERIRRRLEEIVREKEIALFLQDDFITQRRGRWVMPVRMDAKGQVAGVVHDVSNSGETAFMEPLEIIPLANELENLTADEKAEEIRIIRGICRAIRTDSDKMAAEYAVLVRIDLLNAIARFADELRAERPVIGGDGGIRLVRARHPLLMLQAGAAARKKVVPLDLTLGGEDRVLVITGPNAGGKTIAIKTVGLLTVMALSGIPVTAEAESVVPPLESLLVDIGDEQSIEQNLSTFSAHVSKIAEILKSADSRALILMDELGTGTEPLQGAAISCAVLKELKERGALVLATTHLTDIVAFVHRNPGMVNASMEFNRETLTPLYRLKTGEPGQSHALEIARRYGLPQHLLDFAQGMLGTMETEFHELLADLKAKRLAAEEQLAEAERRMREAAEKERRVEERLAEAAEGKRETLEKALVEAREILASARREVNAILEEARREKSREAKQKLEEAQRLAEERLAALRPEEAVSGEEIAEGDTVFVKSIGYDAVVVSVDRRRDRVRIRAGSVEMEVPVAGVTPKKGKELKRAERGRRASVETETPSEINLLGLRVDEALARLDAFLDQAALAGIGEVRVIHGIGTGALMKAVQEHLERHPLVIGYRFGEPFEGGKGATVATLS